MNSLGFDKKEKVNRVDKWFAIDKLQHFSYSCLISLGCQYVFVNKYDGPEGDLVSESILWPNYLHAPDGRRLFDTTKKEHVGKLGKCIKLVL